MKRPHKITKFNKNHILIEEYTNEKNEISYVSSHNDHRNTCYNNPNRYSDTGYYKLVDEKVRHESPLGFYYYTINRKRIPTEKGKKIIATHKTAILYSRYEIYGPRYHYVIQYPHSYNDVYIGVDTRPWDLTDNNGIEDHFIMDLKNLLDKIFEVCQNDKIDLVENHKNYWWETHNQEQYSKKPIGDFKVEIYKDLFGFKDGPKMQTNEEKILSHGFDTKISFRNRKEE